MISIKKILIIREMKRQGCSKYATAKAAEVARSTVYAYWDELSYEPCPHCKKPVNPWHFVKRR